MTGIEPESTINRRRFLFASGAVAAAGAAGSAGAFLPRQRRPDAVEPAVRAVAQRPAPHATTTLETTARLGGAPHTGTYRRLESGPGWPMVVREEIAPPRAGRADRRTPLACFVQFTDLHLADVQNPLRTEFLRSRGASSWRAQEALTVAGAVALVEQVNALGGGPNTRLRPALRGPAASAQQPRVSASMYVESRWTNAVAANPPPASASQARTRGPEAICARR